MIEDILTKEEKAELRKKAAKQVEDELREKAKKEAYEEMLRAERDARRVGDANEEMVEILIDVPASCIINRNKDTGVVVNQREFKHGHKYTVPVSMAAMINYAMFQANFIEASIGYPHKHSNMRSVLEAPPGQGAVSFGR